MSNETKRDVFEELLDAYDDVKSSDGNLHPTQELLDYDDRYDAALPDDIPVIPKAVSEWIKKCKRAGIPLLMILNDTLSIESLAQDDIDQIEDWMDTHTDNDVSNIISRAWAIGVWRIEENGEIVKLEAEK